MKKYVLSVLFFLGCFFVCLSTNVNVIDAKVGVDIKSSDSYDGRKVTIELSDFSPAINRIVVNEVEVCDSISETNCIEVSVGTEGEKHLIRILYSQEYSHNQTSQTASLQYTIKSSGDGEKHFYIAVYHYETNELMSTYSSYYTHTLSTLAQRVVINPDGNGNPTHEYDMVQYTPVRKINFDMGLLETELVSDYSNLVYVCEILEEQTNSRCVEYSIGTDILEYYISSYGDGLKLINFYLVKKDRSINSIDDLNNVDKVKSISKKIYLDTIGPEIVVAGGNWVYVEAGERYTPKDATCRDAIFKDDDCSVSNDANLVSIRYDTEDYQIVTYEATDRIGNTSSVAVKIKVEIPEATNNLATYIIIPVAVLLVTALILGWILIKNNEKKKKMSYI